MHIKIRNINKYFLYCIFSLCFITVLCYTSKRYQILYAKESDFTKLNTLTYNMETIDWACDEYFFSLVPWRRHPSYFKRFISIVL